MKALTGLNPPESGLSGCVYRYCERRINDTRLPADKFTEHRKISEGPTTILVNGMRQSQDEINLNVEMAKRAMGSSTGSIISINNITKGFFKDLSRSAVLYLGGKSVASRSLCEVLKTKIRSSEPVHIHCHSEGALVVRAALDQLYRDENIRRKDKINLRKRLKIVSYGGAFIFDKKFCPYVRNHISILDPIPFITRPSIIFKYIRAAILLWVKKTEKTAERTVIFDHIQFHPCAAENPLKEHSFRGSTYTLPLYEELKPQK
ncbi:MAG: hypothetical protein EB053_02850 [Chlamydiae bacterium]|nr:hypothetical protein [Chlamydiota bacterium]